MAVIVGCAGWNLRKEFSHEFPTSGTHLQRYAQRLPGVEINSSFYRSHRKATYQRWADSTPAHFRFSVKLPKQITHVQRLVNVEERIQQLREETSGLGDKLGTLLVQLPPSLAFDESIAGRFFEQLTAVFDLPVACEPRHPSWFESNAESLLAEQGIGRVAADPSPVPAAAHAGGCQHLVYFRWHGSPRTYYSEYTPDVLTQLAWRLRASHSTADSVWCIFDNTAEGAATKNALTLYHLLVK